MGKTWILDTDTKGTGAQMVPLEKVIESPQPEAPTARKLPLRPARRRAAAPPPRRTEPRKVARTPLGPGQVRKKATGEIGRVESVDPNAGTATVRWLRQGRTSTVPLAAISRN